jgi:hypothetical protein
MDCFASLANDIPATNAAFSLRGSRPRSPEILPPQENRGTVIAIAGTERSGDRSQPENMESMMAERRKTTRPRKVAARKSSRKTPAKKSSPKRWSQRVTRESDALDLKRGVFKLTSAKKIATSLKRSAEHSSRRKAGAYRSALSMLTFYINRAGKTLPKTQRARLERAKVELKHQFGRE